MISISTLIFSNHRPKIKNAFDEDNNLRLEKWLMATEEDSPNSMLIKEQSSGFSINFTLGKVENEALSNIELKEIPTVYFGECVK